MSSLVNSLRGCHSTVRALMSSCAPISGSTGFAKLIWQLASPRWDFDEATFDRTAQSFDNPDVDGF